MELNQNGKPPIPGDLDGDGDVDELDLRLKSFMERRTSVDKLIESNKKRPKPYVDELSFESEVRERWYVYVLLLFSACFSAMLGIYMGMAPRLLENGNLWFNTDFAHLALAAIYGFGFVIVTEVAFALGKWLFYTRESNNRVQSATMLGMMVVSGISIVVTGIAGGIVVASTIDFLSAFRVVPDWAQVWVVRVIPSLIAFYAVLLTAYNLSSQRAESLRIIRENQKAQELDHLTEKQLLELWAQKEINTAAAKHFVRLVEEGKLTAGEAIGAMKAGEALRVPDKRKMASPEPARNFQPVAPRPANVYNAEANAPDRVPNPNGRNPQTSNLREDQ